MVYRLLMLMSLISFQASADPEEDFEYIQYVDSKTVELEAKVAAIAVKSDQVRAEAQKVLQQALAIRSPELSSEMQRQFLQAQTRLDTLYVELDRLHKAQKAIQTYVQTLKPHFQEAVTAIETIRRLNKTLVSMPPLIKESTQQELDLAIVALTVVCEKVASTFRTASTAGESVSMEEQNILRSRDAILTSLRPFHPSGAAPRTATRSRPRSRGDNGCHVQ